MHEVLVNGLGGLSLPRKSVVRITDHPNLTLDVYRGRKTITTTTIYEIKSVARILNKSYPLSRELLQFGSILVTCQIL